MNIGNFNLKIFGLAFVTSCLIFGIIYWINQPKTEAIVNDAPIASDNVEIPELSPTTKTNISTKLTDEEYRQQITGLIRATSLAAAYCLDSFDLNPYILTETETSDGKELLGNLDILSQNYNRARVIAAPDAYAEFHQELLLTLAKLHQAQVELLSASVTLDESQVDTGYNLLVTGSQELTAIDKKL